mmetsp:Transcript_4911/g.14890  ORF Transcript_4911/g.14890 Transcript_4911/m.14890 type:complete len:108 (+) Transcript_4911:104-427(+)
MHGVGLPQLHGYKRTLPLPFAAARQSTPHCMHTLAIINHRRIVLVLFVHTLVEIGSCHKQFKRRLHGRFYECSRTHADGCHTFTSRLSFVLGLGPHTLSKRLRRRGN